MNVSIRPVIEEDGQRIFDLRRDPRLQGMQYSLWWFDSPKKFVRSDGNNGRLPRYGTLRSAILVDDEFAGHISQTFTPPSVRLTGAEVEVSLSWDLFPELWGLGIMPSALNKLLAQRFRQNEKIDFVACCFASNQRCCRVIDKLGFIEEPLGVLEYMDHLLMTWGQQRVIKHRLNFTGWLDAIA